MASEYRIATPELDDPGTSVTLTPASYATWAAMFAANPNKDTYILTAGDYTGWGSLTPVGSGNSSRRRVVRFIDQTTHPVARTDNEALVSHIRPASVDYWIIHGITTRGHTVEHGIDTCTNVVISKCLVEEGTANYGFRVRLGSADCVIQDTVIRNARGASRGDAIGVQIRCNAPNPTPGCRVVDCEIYNYGDSVQITAAADPDELLGFDGTIIDNNDFYTTSDYYSDGDGNDDPAGAYGYTENGVDIKGGGDTTVSYLSNNRIWGYRTTDSAGGGSGSDGSGIVAHVVARNWRVWDNILFDNAAGMREVTWVSGDQVSRQIDYRRNYIVGCRPYTATDHGYAFDIRLTETMVGNVIVDCTTLAWQDVAFGQSAHAMHGNTAAGTALGSYSSHWNATGNNVTRAVADMAVLAVTRKRLTGPETIFLPHCVYQAPLGGVGWSFRPSYARTRRSRR